MEEQERKYHISVFAEKLSILVHELETHVQDKNGEWLVKGFIDLYKNIYTISSDTKIISKILEIYLFPIFMQFAEENGYKIVLAEKQNYYPDLTFISENNEGVMFALDFKTTFRRNGTTVGFTLGSHGSYFKERDKKKNIQFPYNHYTGHFCLGVIYSRLEAKDFPDSNIYHLVNDNKIIGNDEYIGVRKALPIRDLMSITSVIKDFDFFATEKWKIASDSQGSGNTANIGSINDVNDLKQGKGVFSQLGENWFDEYWMNYGVASMVKSGERKLVTNIWDFLRFKGREDLFSKVVAKGAKQDK